MAKHRLLNAESPRVRRALEVDGAMGSLELPGGAGSFSADGSAGSGQDGPSEFSDDPTIASIQSLFAIKGLTVTQLTRACRALLDNHPDKLTGDKDPVKTKLLKNLDGQSKLAADALSPAAMESYSGDFVEDTTGRRRRTVFSKPVGSDIAQRLRRYE